MISTKEALDQLKRGVEPAARPPRKVMLRIEVRVSSEFRDQVRARAAAEDRSVNNWLLRLVKAELQRQR